MHVKKHPKYYKELRERNKSDQAISSNAGATATTSVRPDPGLKLQATSSKPQAQSRKLQVPRSLNHGTSNTQHVSKTLDQGPGP